jgi:glycosyltransferase involved in cell wall biosynthesis
VTGLARITFVLPYYNEAGFVGRAVASLQAQSDRRFALVLVDNASTDQGPEEARAAAKAFTDVDVRFLAEAEPGKLFALRTGCAAVETEFVGTLDADTVYPPDYVAKTLALFDGNPGAVAAFAFDRPLDAVDQRVPLSKWLQVRLFPSHCHTGGYGQAFRTKELKAVGGFDPRIWPFVLEDHEVVQRIGRHGRLAYRRDHVCHTSDRRQDRTAVNWTLFERLLYKLLPDAAMDWFFHRYLRRRFAQRGMGTLRLREQAWKQ